MREIKFRGKRIDNGEWVRGYYLYVEKQNKHYILTGKLKSYPVDYIHPTLTMQGFEWFEVKEKTVSQYTGLKDKNGVEIYEGDIVCTRFPKECQSAGKICSIGDIQFRDGMFGAEWIQWKNDNFWGLRRLDEEFYKVLEVVGNIYDNPELLGGYKNE